MSEKRIHQVDLSDEILKRAAELTPSELKSLLVFMQRIIHEDEKKMKANKEFRRI